MKSNKEILSAILRHVHFAQGFIQQLQSDNDQALLSMKLDKVELMVAELMRANEE